MSPTRPPPEEAAMHVEQADVELEVLVARIERDELEHRPDGPCPSGWGRERQQRLIDTILRDWWVPAVVVAAPRPGSSEVVLDGCHRLDAITRFFHDELTCSTGDAPADREVAALDGLRFGDLPASVRRRVRRFRLTVVTVCGVEPAELAELFERLDHPTRPAPAIPSPRRTSDRPAPPVPAPRGVHRAPVSSEPIYDELSAWFAERSELDGPRPPAWTSPADAGDAAAQLATGTGDEDVTDAGLPQREPLARLVPGSVDAADRPTPARDPAAGDPDDRGERLARHRHGVLEGRREQGGPLLDPPPLPAPIFGSPTTTGASSATRPPLEDVSDDDPIS
jgi:hypothetical protein